MKPLNVLGLFDGISCGQLALERAGIPYDKYYASEIDANARAITQRQHPNTKQLGDVTWWRGWGVDWASIDLVIGGSPCQGFSLAGRQLAFDDPRSKLFFAYRDIVRHVLKHNPNAKWLLENVKMASKYEAAISDEMGSAPMLINSECVSAQSRQRLYWTNFRFTHPERVNVTMRDIIDGPWWSTRDKCYCITANYYKGSDFRRYFYRSAKPILLRDGFDPRPEMTYDNAHLIARENRDKWRSLSPLECERSLTIPDNYTAGAPNSTRYKALGNGWTIDVIAHIFRCMVNGHA